MSLRDKLRKFRTDAKSRIFHINESNDSKSGRSSQSSTPGVSHRWDHLKTFLRALEQATRPLPPLKAAVAELAECIDRYEGLLRERKEYEILYHELEELFQVLQHHCTQNIPPTVTEVMEGLCNVIILEEKHLTRILQDNRLNRLTLSLSACYNSAQAVELKRGPCTKGTRIDLLSQMFSWVGSSNPGSVYWMSGMAGTGKTTIAYSLCEELDAAHKLAASFFCSRLLPECRDVNLIIPSIAYQLARFSHPFRFVLSRVLEKDPDVHTRLPHLQFDSLISKPLLEVKDTLPDTLVVVIDALDECENKEATSRILDVVITKSSNLPIKFIMSSRPEPEIRDEMDKQNNQASSRVVLHELDKDTVQADIEIYLRSALAQIQPTEHEVATLVERAGILFIYAATTVRYISYDRFRRNPRARLANVLRSSSTSENKNKEIDQLYTVILRAAFDDPSLDDSERDDMRHVLHSIICAQEPLTVNALSNLLRVYDLDRVHAALRPLWSVLHISGTNELVTTLHASFLDYILDPSRSKQYYCDFKTQSQTLVQGCFELFKDMRPQFNICNLGSSYIPDDQVEGLEERINDAISTELFYASRYWAVHLHSAIGCPDLISQLEEFLSARLLLWMEVMNLKKCVGAMPQAIRLVETWKAERPAELNALIHDAWRFTSTFALGAVSDNTTHIYISMLPFWPDSSPVANCYARRTRKAIQVEGTAVEQQRHALLASWNLYKAIYSLAFSPDGKHIAVGLEHELLLLNSSTGRMVLPPFKKGDSLGPVISVQFSPDGARIASGSHGGSIHVWNTQNGELVLGPLQDTGLVIEPEDYNRVLSSVAFSHDGARIVSGSRNGKILIWDACNGERILDLATGHEDDIDSVKYSPDGRHIVSCSAGRILIWDAQDGEVLRTLRLDDGPHFMFADISPDGSQIATVSFDDSIHIWDYATGQLVLGPLIASGSDSSAILGSFLPDGSHLISGSHNGTIDTWDIRNGGILLGTLEGAIKDLSAATFSPDGAYFISGSVGGTLCLWDTQSMKAAAKSLDHHTRSIGNVEFSTDGTRIICDFGDSTVRVWDVENGEMIVKPLDGHNASLKVSAFSLDNTRIASAVEYSHKLVLLDALTGDIVLGPLQQPEWIYSIGLSPDGTLIAVGLKGFLRILAVDTGESIMVIHLPRIKNEPDWVYLILFSPDGTRIAVGSSVGNLSVYDTHTGRLLHGPFNAYTHGFHPVVFSSDSTRIIYSTGLAFVVKNVQSGEELLQSLKLDEEIGCIRVLGFSHDDSHIVSNSTGNNLCIWDTRTGQLLCGPVKLHADLITMAAFSSNGMQLVTGSIDGIIRVTDTSPRDSEFEAWEMRQDGWVVDELSRLLVWIPADLRAVLMWPRTKLLNSSKGYLRLKLDEAYLGERWMECYSPIQ
ncbi:unnamed protein product [Rhizoctonia solani]|uniref:Nephrocystin 3-like N-terminal domain-containing protein n=1 Tax=Rhizoctonia solani TaxID=456999 RepID=A0A8H3HER5_9AGAM|nr:unnamed protein product [Rhizoctonia solani]